MKILFVCTGNTCRSPLAEAILKYKRTDWTVRSAGLFASNGSDASLHAKQVMEEEGLGTAHTAQNVTQELLEWADFIFTMTASHKQLLLSHYPEAKKKIWTLKEYTSGRQEDVIDPYGGSLASYRQTYKELDSLIEQLINKLK